MQEIEQGQTKEQASKLMGSSDASALTWCRTNKKGDGANWCLAMARACGWATCSTASRGELVTRGAPTQCQSCSC